MVNKLILLIVAIILWRQVIPIGQLIMNFRLNDFSVYLDGTKSALSGANPYQLRFFDRFNYSPAATLFFIPLTLIPENTAEFLFTAISAFSLLLTIKMIFELLKIKLSPSIFWLIFVLALKTYPSKLTLALGQINLIILGLIVGSYYFCEIYKGRTLRSKVRPFEALSGILFGLAAILKLTPAPLLIYFLFRKRWRTVWWFMVTIGILTIAGISVFGWDLTYYYYFKTIPQLMNENTRTTLNGSYMNQSVTALLGKFGIFGELNSITRLGISGILGVFFLNDYLYRFRVKPGMTGVTKGIKDFISFWNLTVITMLFLPVFVWQHHYVFLIPLWVILVAKLIKTKKMLDLAISGLAYFLLIFYFKDSYLPLRLNPLLSSHFLTTAVLFMILNSYAQRPDQQHVSDSEHILKNNSRS
ncbi:DUF2029 domain-containing protein [Candidatus Collierbacteria bacterium]|nr:DUF2029 domain-containing protein [Candidatus Collierbacteria bacterium]